MTRYNIDLDRCDNDVLNAVYGTLHKESDWKKLQTNSERVKFP